MLCLTDNSCYTLRLGKRIKIPQYLANHPYPSQPKEKSFWELPILKEDDVRQSIFWANKNAFCLISEIWWDFWRSLANAATIFLNPICQPINASYVPAFILLDSSGSCSPWLNWEIKICPLIKVIVPAMWSPLNLI